MSDDDRDEDAPVFRRGMPQSDFPIDFDPRRALDDAMKHQREAERRLDMEEELERR